MSALEILNKISQDAKDDIESDDSAPYTDEDFLPEDESVYHSMNAIAQKSKYKSIFSVEAQGFHSQPFDTTTLV